MKKLIAALTIALSIGTASAHPAYDMGYRHGKNDAYHRVATTVVVAGIAIIAGCAPKNRRTIYRPNVFGDGQSS